MSSAADVPVLFQLSHRAMQAAHEYRDRGAPVEAALALLAGADVASTLSRVFAAHDLASAAKWHVISQLRRRWAQREYLAAGLHLG